MTLPRRSSRDVSTLLAELYDAGTPDYRDDLVQRIAATRQRPVWAFPERWLPMDIATQAVPTARFPWRAVGVLAVLAALLAIGLAVFIGQQIRLPDPFGLAANGRIAWTSDGDVYVADRPDAPPRLLIGGPETETWAQFSPLGDRLMVLREAEGGEDLWVGSSDGAGLVRIAGPYRSIDWIEWSPDQRSIALSYDRRGINAIDLVAVDGSGSRRIGDFPAMSPIFRPPDGAQLLFRGQQQGRWGFYLVDVDTPAEPVRLAIEGEGLISGAYDLRLPTWSPTGDRLAFDSLFATPDSALGTPGLRIALADIGPDGSVRTIHPLEFDPLADDELQPVFTPDGRHLVYQQRMGPTGDPQSEVPTADTVRMFEIEAALSGPATSVDLGILSEGDAGLGILPAPDGRSIIVHLWAQEEDWIVNPLTGTARRTDFGSSSGVSWQRRAP
jgi:Tol biopolymer transport system component